MTNPAFLTLRRIALVAAILLQTLAQSVSAQQQHRDYGVRGATFNPGRGPYAAPGNVRVSGGATFGPVGTAQQLGAVNGIGFGGSRATWNSGGSSFGVGRGPNGAWNDSTGAFCPPVFPTAAYGYSPYFPGYNFSLYPTVWGWSNVGDPTGFGVFDPNSNSPGVYNGPLPGWGPGSYAVHGQGSLWHHHPWLGSAWGNNVWVGNGFNNGWGANPWCISSVPYFGGLNPHFTGSILAPTVISMNISMMPSVMPNVPSTASYALTDPRMLDFLAPAPMLPNEEMPVDDPGNLQFPDAPPQPQPDMDLPLLNEFKPSPRSGRVSTLAEKIQSLSHQSAGDESFRRENYDKAISFYQLAIDSAPDRRAPWIRMAFAQLASERFDFAVSRLKTGLSMPDDAGRSWVTAEELYGTRIAERSRSHGLALLNWLSERPTSADRLLLTGTFQKLRGHEDVAAELLQLSSHQGPEALMASTVLRLASEDVGHRDAAEDLSQFMLEASAKSDKGEFDKTGVDKGEEAPRDPNGIYLKGRKQ